MEVNIMKYQIEVTKMDGTKWRNNRCGKGFDLGNKLNRLIEKYTCDNDIENVDIIPFRKTNGEV